MYPLIDGCHGFQWDEGNGTKNWLKHRVTEGEAEQVFFNTPLLLSQDERHSTQENRFHALGRTDEDRGLFIVFTIRKDLVRVISARDMNEKERNSYETFKNNTQI